MKLRFFLALLLTTLLLSGCMPINVSLFGHPRPLEEQIIEGSGDKKIVIIELAGFISEKESGSGFRQTPSTVVLIKEALQKAAEERDVAGIILRINSPGGTVTASDIIHHEIVGFRKKTKLPVYAVITGIGASGGYYAAAGCDEISAHPTAVTGSIGVVLMKFQVTGLMEKIGVSEQTVKSGIHKDILSPFRPGTPVEDGLLQEIIDQMHRRFVEVVQNRPGSTLDKCRVEKLADGRLYTAEQALNVGLIDRVEYLDETIIRMKQRLGLERATIVSYYHSGDYKGTIYSALPGGGTPTINLINLDLGNLEMLNSSKFLYLWQ
jgi:protease IV